MDYLCLPFKVETKDLKAFGSTGAEGPLLFRTDSGTVFSFVMGAKVPFSNGKLKLFFPIIHFLPKVTPVWDLCRRLLLFVFPV